MSAASGARVAWVSEEAPDRSLGGGNIRQAHLFRALSARVATDLVVTARVTDPYVREYAAEVIELDPVQPLRATGPLGRRALDLAALLGSRYPTAVHPARGNRRSLAGALRGRRYDLVCVEHEALAPLAPALETRRRIITFHHLLSQMTREQLALAPGPRQRWFRRRDLAKAQRLERQALAAYDLCVVCSDEDRARLAALAPEAAYLPAAVIPNGVDLQTIRPGPIPRSRTVVMPGTLSWPPNIDGARWLCTAIWPRVRTALPDAELVLVGRNPPPDLRALAQLDGVTVKGDVPSMVPYLEAAGVVAVPMRVGTGTRLKALEALAAGRPVVGTSVGLEGIGIVDGVHARVADDPADFALAVIELLRHREAAERLAHAGRAHVESRFGWELIGDRFAHLVCSMLEVAAADQAPARSASSET